jgi:hypothetical protein
MEEEPEVEESVEVLTKLFPGHEISRDSLVRAWQAHACPNILCLAAALVRTMRAVLGTG